MARQSLIAKIIRGLALGMLLGTTSSMAATFTVNSTADTNDSTPGDGVCADAGGNCSLRAAIEEANALAGADEINALAGTYLLTLGTLGISDDLTVSGAGAASTIVDGNSNAGQRIFSVGADLVSVTLQDMTLRNANTGGGGGALSVGGNSPTLIQRVTLSGNQASYGGAVSMGGNSELVVVDSIITGNQSGNNPGGSAFILFAGDRLTLRSSTISGNGPSGSGSGAGVILEWSNGSAPVSITLENSTIAGNAGDAIRAYTATVDIVNSTITNNDIGLGAYASNGASQATVTNSILYANGSNCAVNGGSITSGGYNIDGRDSCGFTATGDRVNTDPMLGPLADNGGSTQTRGLLAGSPALDAGDNNLCPGTDQRGTLRNDGSCDIGAFEGSVGFATCLSGHLAVNSSTDAVDANIGDGICNDGTGACTLRAAVQEANACIGADTITVPAGTYPLTLTGLNENAAATGDLDILDDLTINGAGAATTLIDAGALFDDRIFHVLNNVTTAFSGLTLQGVSNNNLAGGGIATGGDLQVSNAVISGNTAGHGAAVYSWDANAVTDIASTTLSNNSGNYGGAVYVAGTLNLVASTVSGNTSSSYGGAIYGSNGSMLNITNGSLIDNNTVGFGGQAAVVGWDNSTVNITDSTVSNTQDGRGVTGWTDSTVNITRSRITGNLSGGIGTRGSGTLLNITDSTIDGNSTPYWGGTSGIDGAGISSEGTLNVNRSTISNNLVYGYAGGAGIFAADGTITNSTISGNRMPGPGNNAGGGLRATGSFTITNSTIANNNIYGSSGWLRWGGGVYGGTVVFKNTILSANLPNNCESSTVISGGHNIDSGNTCGLTHATDLVNTDPMLDVLADNGGWTQTHALLSNVEVSSPALDAGDATFCAGAPVNGTDQRGFARPWGAGCDIGAYEDMPLYMLSLTVTGTGSGRVTSSPGTLNCPAGTCTAMIGENTPVQLTAVPAADSVFGGWSGDCATGGIVTAKLVSPPAAAGSASVLVDADKSCTATFIPVQHTLSVVISPLGTGKVTGVLNQGETTATVVIDCGTDCTETLPGSDGVITLVPAKGSVGWSFSGWDGCDSLDSYGVWCTMTLDADKVLTANFVSANIYVDDAFAPVDDRDMPFGDVIVGTSVNVTVTITNTGEGDLDEIWLQQEDWLSAPFSMQESCSDDWLAPGASCSFTVSFTPTATGTYSDTFDIISGDPDEPTLTVTVSGTGIVEAAPPDEPLPTAEIGFRMKGEGGSGATGPLELLLALVGLGFAARRRIAGTAIVLGISLLVLSLSFGDARAAGPGWYIGASGGQSSSDYSDSDLRSDLVNKGYAITSVSVDDTDTGWKIFGGYQFNQNWAIETAWVDLGDVKSTVGGTIDDAQVPALLSDAASNHGYMGEGATLAGVAIWPVTPQIAPFIKLGAFSWKADVDIDERTTGQSISRNRSGTDMMGGLGLRYTPTPNLEFRAEYEYFDIDPDAAGFFSLGIGYHF